MTGVAGFSYVVFAFVALFIINRSVITKLNSRNRYRREVKSMKIKTMSRITNVLSNSLEVMGAIGVNILSTCLLT